MTTLDERLLRIGIEVNGQMKFYEGLEITASGQKVANATQDECEVKITNVDRATSDFILTETSPFNKNRTPKIIEIYAGRKSYGAALIFRGDITSAKPTQPPDISINIKAQTGSFSKGDVIALTEPAISNLSVISRNVAQQLGLTLNFEATDKQVSNFNFSGGKLKLVDALGAAGGVRAFVDGETLNIKNQNTPLRGLVRVLNIDTGLIGQPEITEEGVKVKYLLDNSSAIGGALRITSVINPAVNGEYDIYKLGFELANRAEPFYWVAEAKRL